MLAPRLFRLMSTYFILFFRVPMDPKKELDFHMGLCQNFMKGPIFICDNTI